MINCDTCASSQAQQIKSKHPLSAAPPGFCHHLRRLPERWHQHPAGACPPAEPAASPPAAARAVACNTGAPLVHAQPHAPLGPRLRGRRVLPQALLSVLGRPLLLLLPLRCLQPRRRPPQILRILAALPLLLSIQPLPLCCLLVGPLPLGRLGALLLYRCCALPQPPLRFCPLRACSASAATTACCASATAAAAGVAAAACTAAAAAAAC